MENEKRKRERFSMNQVLDLSTSDGQAITAQGINISEGGILCRTETGIPQGTLVKFQLLVPGSKTNMTVPCEGFVLRCTEKDGKFDVVIDFTD